MRLLVGFFLLTFQLMSTKILPFDMGKKIIMFTKSFLVSIWKKNS